ncbi:hypothetical protein [Paenibacillus chibensis]|nr:hypothetical protein [Paenibacillus chibensis]MEC0370620.1 hypothetical protein [Paenibacillus chibensis]
MGTWIPKQVSQVVGKQFELVEYQAWDVTENEFILFTDDPAADGTGKLPNSAVKVSYHWNSKHEIMLDGKPYTVEVDKEHLIVKNSELEIQLDRKS